MRLSIGDPFPRLQGHTPTSLLRMDYMAGRYIVLAFLPASAPLPEVREVMAQLAAHEALFDDSHCCFFGVLRHPQQIASARNSIPGIRWFLDPYGDLFLESGMSSDEEGDRSGWFVLDPTLRIMKTAPLSRTAEVMRWVSELPSVNDYAGTPIHAPVLIVPRVFEIELCAEIVAHYRQGRTIDGGLIDQSDGVVSQPFVDKDYRSARQLSIPDGDLKARMEDRIRRRLAPEVLRALRYRVGDVRSYLVAAYDAAEAGRFRPHRDNMPPLEQRQFTIAINLNEDFEGGDLRFPEYGARTYRAPAGGAVVFASSLLHEVTLLTSGRRYVTICFFVDGPASETRFEEGDRGREAVVEVHG